MAYTIVEFPIEMIELNIEITHHPILIREMREVAALEGYDLSMMIATVAAYCEVILDGAYTQEDIKRICTILTNKLRQKRSLLVLPTSMLTH